LSEAGGEKNLTGILKAVVNKYVVICVLPLDKSYGCCTIVSNMISGGSRERFVVQLSAI
jgi:hypothetical protein